MEQKPLYERIADSIRQSVIQGNMREGDLLTGELDLMKQYKVGRETVRRALKILVDEGLIIRRPGKGTQICRRIKPDSITKVVSFSSEIIKLGMVPSTRIKEICVIKAGEELAKRLGIKTGEDIININRICYADAIPIAVEEGYIDKAVLEHFDEKDFSGSIYKTLTEKYRIRYSKMKQSISPVILEKHMADELECGRISSFELKRTIYNAASKPFYFLRFFVRGDMYAIESEVKF